MPPKRSKVRKAASAQAAKPAKSTPANSPKKQATKKDNASQVQSSEAADKENDSDNVCSICMDTPSKMDVTKLSGCKHLFCFDCIEAWSKEENTCPLCKERFTSITRVHASPAGKGKRKKGLPKSKKIKKASQADGSFGGLPSPNFFINMIMRNAAHGNPFLGPLAARAGGIFLGGGPPQSLPPHIMLQMFSELNGVVSSRRSFGSEDSSMYDEDYEDEDDDNFLDDSDGDTDELFHTARLRASNLLGGILGGMPTSPPPNIRSHAKNDADENAGTADNALILSDSDDDAKQAKPATRKKPAKSAGPINIDLSDDEPDYHDCATGKSESGSVNSSGNGNGNGNGSDNSNSNSNSNANSNANSNVNSPIDFSKPSPGRKGPPIKRKKTEAGGGGAAKKKKSG